MRAELMALADRMELAAKVWAASGNESTAASLRAYAARLRAIIAADSPDAPK